LEYSPAILLSVLYSPAIRIDSLIGSTDSLEDKDGLLPKQMEHYLCPSIDSLIGSTDSLEDKDGLLPRQMEHYLCPSIDSLIGSTDSLEDKDGLLPRQMEHYLCPSIDSLIGIHAAGDVVGPDEDLGKRKRCEAEVRCGGDVEVDLDEP